MATKVTLKLNEVHKPSVSFLEPEPENFLDSQTFNGKVYFTKDYLRSIKWNGEDIEVTITTAK